MTAVLANSDELRELYRELILDHARKPRHFGKLPQATHQAQGINPLCGDKLHVYLEISDGHVKKVTFEGSGCAISIASASLLTETVIGLSVADAERWFAQVTAALTGAEISDEPSLGKLSALQGVREFPSRVKCATLAWHALHAAIEEHDEPASTEK